MFKSGCLLSRLKEPDLSHILLDPPIFITLACSLYRSVVRNKNSEIEIEIEITTERKKEKYLQYKTFKNH